VKRASDRDELAADEADLRRRLEDLATAVHAAPDAWDRLLRRIAVFQAPRHSAWLRRPLVASAAAALVAMTVASTLAHHDDGSLVDAVAAHASTKIEDDAPPPIESGFDGVQPSMSDSPDSTTSTRPDGSRGTTAPGADGTDEAPGSSTNGPPGSGSTEPDASPATTTPAGSFAQRFRLISQLGIAAESIDRCEYSTPRTYLHIRILRDGSPRPDFYLAVEDLPHNAPGEWLLDLGSFVDPGAYTVDIACELDPSGGGDSPSAYRLLFDYGPETFTVWPDGRATPDDP